MNPTIQRLAECGQSIWYDNISRGMLDSGAMQALVDDGVVGVTSNPTIFQKAIGETREYDAQMSKLVAEGRSAEEIYDALTQADIARTADLFAPVYKRTEGLDGYVSIEVSPHLADDTQGTLAEARRLFKALGKPNVMIKIPGTPAGIPAIEGALAEGININVTLIFSVDAYQQIMEAYRRGLERWAASGGDPRRVASVASFFVSRVDTDIDKLLGGKPDSAALAGKAAIANSKLAYRAFQAEFAKPWFTDLKKRGARVQRPLWASTSTKNPAYAATMYVATLVGRDTVNTVPPATLDAIRAGFDVKTTVTDGVSEAEQALSKLEKAGVSIAKVTDALRVAGVKSFADSYDKLIAAIEVKRHAIAAA
jgi:transaldolase/glucose-6-phosphate isomerase